MQGSPRADFFVLRAPLLPLETLAGWVEGAEALAACVDPDGDEGSERLAQALQADRVLLRRRLAELAADEQVADGLELTLPDLADALAIWRRQPDSKRGRSAERALVRYVTRLASRSDLYGLAGGYEIGRFSRPGRLELAPRSRIDVRARVDSGLLREVVRKAASEAAGRPELMVRRNPALYRVGGRLRVAARKPGSAAHRLVEIRSTPAIELALERSAGGISIGSLLAALEASGTPADHAPELVGRLMRSDFLVPLAEVAATGAAPAAQATEALRSLPGVDAYAGAVDRAVGLLAEAPRVGRRTIDAVAQALAATGVEVARRSCLHVDVRRPGDVRLPERALTELRRSIDLLAQVSPRSQNALESFREAFERRFATRSVPLLEALDPDLGIRIGQSGSEADSVPQPPGPARQRALLALVERGRPAAGSVDLTDADLAHLAPARPHVLPGSFALLTSLVCAGPGALAAGDVRLVEPTLVGPSGARLLGRLCRGDSELEALVREHLRGEAAFEPDAVFAELSAAPETDAGLSITHRPLLRDWEIEYGGGSGAPPERRLEPSDLTVSVENGEVVLWSAKLDRKVVPSSTTAMNAMWLSLPAARFLLSLSSQGVSGFLGWSWDDLADAPVLPRVTRGRTILALRRWNVPAAELADLRPGTDAAGFRRLQRWRLERGIPRLVTLDHPKSRLLVDFGNVLGVDAFLASAGGLDLLRFVEVLPADESAVTGPDGHYAHELIIPFLLDRPGERPAPTRRARRPVSERRRRFPPGSEWLYVNLYGPPGAADRLLVEHVGPLTGRLRRAGRVDRWFFIRYADPASHLRVRWHGDPRELLTEVLPALNEALAPALDNGLLYRISVDTYEREVERYGGLAGVELMEQVAEADSNAVVEILSARMTAAERRHLAVASVAGLFAASGLPLETRLACCIGLRKTWTPPGVPVGQLFGRQERAERAEVAQAVADLDAGEATAAILPLRARAAAVAPAFGRLRALEEEGILEQPLPDVVSSLAHMAVNRLLRRGGNVEEAGIHHALARVYEGQIGRERKPGPAARRAAPTRSASS